MYSMKETCQKTNLSYATLKYYCNEGLVPYVKRDKNNNRVFDEHDIGWIRGLMCLKDCGMSIAEMKAFMYLCLQGEKSIPQRKVILSIKKEELKKQIQLLNESIDYIDHKQHYYDDVLAGRVEYDSNLLPRE